MRKAFLVVIGLLAIAYIVFSLAELKSILAVLRQSKPLYLDIAIVVEAVLLLNTTAAFMALYHLVGLRESGPNLFLMVIAATFVNLITPSSGIGGVVVFLDEAQRRSQSTGRVTVAMILYVLYEYAALFFALAAGFFLLAQLGKLNVFELLAAGFLLILATSIGAGLVLGYRSTRQLGNVLAWLARGVNHLLRPFLHREYFTIASVYTFSNELTDGLSSLHSANLGETLLPLVFTSINKLLLILELGLAFLALDTPVSAGTVVAGFSIGHLFVYASPTPSGIGFVDSILPVALNSLDVPLPRAVLVTLVYRAVTLWLPLVLGALAFRTLQRSRSRG
jgi:glycosyltransferase 2 family protein